MDLTDVPLGFKLGDIFTTVDEFHTKLVAACNNKCIQFYKRDSLTIAAAAKKVKRYLNKDLKFYKVQYCCIHGGREFKTTGTGKRNYKTFRGVDLCPATLTIRLSSTGNEFQLIVLNTNHNHQVDPVLFRLLPQQRKLPKEIKEEARRLLKLKANKHLLRQTLEEKSHKVIKLKDLQNLRQKDRLQYKNNIESSVRKINNKFESDCHLLIDEDNVFKGLMFATPTMKNAMRAFPEILCLDATYKLLNIRAPVYLILIEDGCGESVVVAVGILLSEDHESLKWFLEAFKNMNPSWTNTKNIMADKDLNEREVLKICFPQAQISICLFHVFKIFQREITTEKMKITSLERNLTLELLQKLTFSKTYEEFDKIKSEISNSLSQAVVQYLEKHWTNIRDEWCPYLGEKILNLMNRTNNRVENINSKLKAVITKNSTLEEFLEHLFAILSSLEKERQIRLAEKINKRSIMQYNKTSPEYSYLSYVSEYAFTKVLNQLNNRKKVKVTSIDGNYFVIERNTVKDGGNEKQKATQNTCDCYFNTSMGLPCKHIFCVRDYLKLELFEETVVNKRWTKQYIFQNQHFFKNLSDRALLTNYNTPTNSIDMLSPTTTKVYSQQDKYKKAFSKCKLIAALSCEASGKRFKNVMSALDDFIHLLENNNHLIKVTSTSGQQWDEDANYDSEFQNCNELNSVERGQFPSAGGLLREDGEIAISGNRCTPDAIFEVNDLNCNMVTSENISTAQDILQIKGNCNNLNNMQIIGDISIEEITEAQVIIPIISNCSLDNVFLNNNNDDTYTKKLDIGAENKDLCNTYTKELDIAVENQDLCDTYTKTLDIQAENQDLGDTYNKGLNIEAENQDLCNTYTKELDIAVENQDLCDTYTKTLDIQAENQDLGDTYNKGLNIEAENQDLCDIYNKILDIETKNQDLFQKNIKFNIAGINNDRSPYLKNDREVLSLLLNQTESNLENVQFGNKSKPYTTVENSSQDKCYLNKIKLPPILKHRGRPSGSEKTVIGLPSRKKRKSSTIPFHKIKITDRSNIILKWIIKKETNIQEKRVLDKSDLKTVEDVDIRLTEVNLSVLKKFFTVDAFQEIVNYKNLRKKNGIWLCNNYCKQNIKSDPSIRCDRCLVWSHMGCTDYHQEGSLFFCGKCDF